MVAGKTRRQQQLRANQTPRYDAQRMSMRSAPARCALCRHAGVRAGGRWCRCDKDSRERYLNMPPPRAAFRYLLPSRIRDNAR